MRRVTMTGLYLGLVLACLSWTGTLVSYAYHGAWTLDLAAGIYWVTVIAWLWLGWRFAAAYGALASAFGSGAVAGAVMGVLTAVVQIFVPASALPSALGGTGNVAVVIGEVLVTALFGAVLAALGYSVSRLVRRFLPGRQEK